MKAIDILNYIQTEMIIDNIFVDLYIVEDKVFGYFKTKYIKYPDIHGNKVSYLFPVEFIFKNNLIETTMTLGFVDNNFIPPNVNGSNESTKLITKKIESNLYSILIAKQSGVCAWGLINITSFQCLIESLNYIGFPFIKITTNELLSKKGL